MNKKAMGVIFSYLLIVVDILVALLFVPFLLKSLGEDEYGLYRLLYSTASYLAVLDFGLGGTITRYIVKYRTEGNIKQQENFMAMGLIIYGLLALVTLVVSVGITVALPFMYGNSISAAKMQEAQLIFLILCSTHAVTLFSHAYNGLFTAFERFTYTKVSNIAKILFRVGILVLGLRFIKSALLIAVVDFALALLLLLCHIFFNRFCKIKLHKWDGKLAKESLVFTSAILIQSIVNQFNTNVANVVLGIFSTTAVIAMYSLVLQLYTMYGSISTAISTVFLPSISAAVFRGEDDTAITQKVVEPSRIQLLLLLLVASGFILYGKTFVSLWVGPGYEIVHVLVSALMIAALLDLSQNTIDSVLKAKNKLHGKSLILAVSTAVNFGLTCLLVPTIGAWGAVIGSCFSLIFGYGVALNIYYHKVIHINMFTYYKKTYAGILPATLLCLPIGYIIGRFNPLHGWIGFLLEVAVYALIFVVMMLLLGLNKSEKALVHKVLAKFGIRK